MNLALSLPTQRYYRIAVSCFYFVQGITFATWASRIPDIQLRLGLSEGALGGILFALPMGQLSAMAMSGYLVNRFGSKAMLSLGAILYPLTLLLLGVVQYQWQLFAGLFLFGVLGNLSNISINTQGVGVERLYRRSIMASFHGLWSLAGFVGGIVAGLIVAVGVSPLWHFILVNVLTIVIILSARPYLMPRDSKLAASKETKKKAFVKPDAFIVTLGLIAFACMICEGTMFDWSSIYFQKVVAAPQTLTRLGYIAFMCTMAGGRFVSDAFVTRFGITRVLQVSGIIIFVGMMLAVAIPNLLLATIGFLLVGIGVSSVVPLTYSLAGRSTRMAPGIALTMVSSIGFLGFLLGPPVIGFIAEWFNLRVSFGIIAVLGLGTLLLAKRLSTLKR
jgi:MFS family permease